jgi:hypothetical protein
VPCPNSHSQPRRRQVPSRASPEGSSLPVLGTRAGWPWVPGWCCEPCSPAAWRAAVLVAGRAGLYFQLSPAANGARPQSGGRVTGKERRGASPSRSTLVLSEQSLLIKQQQVSMACRQVLSRHRIPFHSKLFSVLVTVAGNTTTIGQHFQRWSRTKALGHGSRPSHHLAPPPPIGQPVLALALVAVARKALRQIVGRLPLQPGAPPPGTPRQPGPCRAARAPAIPLPARRSCPAWPHSHAAGGSCRCTPLA